MTHEGYLAKRTSEQIRTERTSIRETYLRIILIQAFLFVSCVIISPGYVTTTFKNETALSYVAARDHCTYIKNKPHILLPLHISSRYRPSNPCASAGTGNHHCD